MQGVTLPGNDPPPEGGCVCGDCRIWLRPCVSRRGEAGLYQEAVDSVSCLSPYV